jgi:YD repeat-containing protein
VTDLFYANSAIVNAPSLSRPQKTNKVTDLFSGQTAVMDTPSPAPSPSRGEGLVAAGRMLAITDPRGITYLTNVYDSAGRVSQQTLADGGIWEFAYMADLGIVGETMVTDPNGKTTEYRFTGRGYVVTQTDALGQTTTTTRDPATNEVLATADALGRKISFTYDAVGNTTSITDPNNNMTRFEYDPTFNRVVPSACPAGWWCGAGGRFWCRLPGSECRSPAVSHARREIFHRISRMLVVHHRPGGGLRPVSTGQRRLSAHDVGAVRVRPIPRHVATTGKLGGWSRRHQFRPTLLPECGPGGGDAV